MAKRKQARVHKLPVRTATCMFASKFLFLYDHLRIPCHLPCAQQNKSEERCSGALGSYSQQLRRSTGTAQHIILSIDSCLTCVASVPVDGSLTAGRGGGPGRFVEREDECFSRKGQQFAAVWKRHQFAPTETQPSLLFLQTARLTQRQMEKLGQRRPLDALPGILPQGCGA